jgi:hypothetical protein
VIIGDIGSQPHLVVSHTFASEKYPALSTLLSIRTGERCSRNPGARFVEAHLPMTFDCQLNVEAVMITLDVAVCRKTPFSARPVVGVYE